MQQHSTKFLRRRKFLLVLPLLVIPFVTLAFRALGGGKGADARTEQTSPHQGLNLELPGASIKENKVIDKLGYYEKAEEDSARLKKLIKDDPYYDKELETEVDEEFNAEITYKPVAVARKSGRTKKYNDPNEEKGYRKLEQLNSALNEASSRQRKVEDNYLPSERNPAMQTEDVDRLEEMMQMMSGNNTGSDPEMDQLNGVMEKILDIQHPERIREKLKEMSVENKDQVYTVSSSARLLKVSLLDTTPIKQSVSNGFYGLEAAELSDTVPHAIEAVVHENQVLVNGAVVKMRLLNEIYINGHLIPKDNFVFGIASLNNERLEIEINSIRDEHSLFPVKLEVYDMDGLSGIYIPGAITRDVAKQSANNSLQSIGMTSLDPSLEVQAASVGIETAKNLLSKKGKLVEVQVKAGYKILLKDKNLRL